MRIRTKRAQAQRLAAWLNMTMSVIYLFCGGFLFFSKDATLIVPDDYLYGIAAGLFFYGIFRLVRSYLQLTNKNIQ